jgi:hypothetical protein
MDECQMNNMPLFATIATSALAGLALGFVYFRTLRISADLIVNGGSALLALGLGVVRLGLLVAGFYLAVQFGAAALIAALAGVLTAKAMLLRGAKV